MILQVDPGAEKYLSLARRFAAKVEALRARIKLPAISKFLVPEPGFMVWVKATTLGITVRITGSVAGGRIFVSSTGDTPTAVHRWYRLVKGKLTAYAELDAAALVSTTPSSSFDGKAALGVDTAENKILASIDQLPSAQLLASGGWTVQSLSTGASNETGIAKPRQNVATNGLGPAYLTEDGSLVAASVGSNGLPGVLLASLAPDSATDPTTSVLTQLDQCGFPQFMLDFYAAKGLTLITDGVYAVPLVPSRTSINVPAVTIVQRDPSSTGAGTGDAQPSCYVMHDPSSNRMYCMARIPYVSSYSETFSGVSGGHNLYTVNMLDGLRIELRYWDSARAAWVLEYVEDYPSMVTQAVTLTDADVGIFRPGTTGAGTDFASAPTSYLPAATLAGARLFGLYGTQMKASGVVVGQSYAAALGQPQVSALSKQAAVAFGTIAGVGTHIWCGATWNTVFTAYTKLAMNPTGETLLAWKPPSYEIWRSGSLVTTYPASGLSGPATANSTNYPTYKDVPASGFYAILDKGNADGFFGWRFDKSATLKATVFTHMTLTPGSPGVPAVFLHVYGGTMHVPAPFGDIVISQANNDGFNATGTLVLVPNGDGTSTSFTPAQIDALFGVSGTTFELDGTQYDINLGGSAPTPDSYAWATATVDLAWNAEAGAMKLVATYSDVPVAVDTRGDLTETIVGATAAFSDAQLIQDALVMRKPGPPR